MKRVYRIIVLALVAPVSLVLALATSAAATNVAPLSAAAAISAAHLPNTTAVPESPVGCNAGNFCVYSQVSPGICTVDCPQPCDQTAANVKHNYTTCANEEESLDNNMSGGKARLYFAMDEGGAWICIDAGKAIDDLRTGNPHDGGGAYEFDQGSGLAGHDAPVWHNAHSVHTLSSGSCNPDE